MRSLTISALAATLVGCTCFTPQQAQQASLMSHSAAGTPRTDSSHPRHRRKANSDAKIVKPNTVPKMDVSSSVQSDDKSTGSINVKSTVTPMTETPQSTQPNDKFDPVLKKAIPTIAAKLENSASVELVEMKRAEKNAHGRSIDTICGYVRGKSASGAEIGDRPFLYLVQDDQAYIGGYNMATSPYHNLCDK